MRDKIEPALMAEEWPQYTADDSGGPSFRGRIRHAVDECDVEGMLSTAGLMALCNAALPGDSPYKITRDWIALLVVAQVEARKAVGVDCLNGPCDECGAACERFCARLQHMADVIAALLPPE